MDCKTFTELLPQYLAGDLSEAEFSLVVAHEALCPDCGELAAAGMSEICPSDTTDDNWLTETLERTLGADCRYIEMKIAATFDGDSLDDLSQSHITDCPNCQALVRTMAVLPEFYAAYPRLRADKAFVRDILALTVGKAPSIWEIFRTLVQRPEAILEGALACALIAVPFAGDIPTKVIENANNARKAIVQQVGLDDISVNIDRKLIDADKHFQEIKKQRNTALKTEFSKAHSWAKRQVDQAEDKVSNLTDTDPSTGSPAARVVSWTERALGNVGLIDNTETNTTNPDETPGTQ
jgi:Putative zinc-finger